jgi:hypothetical protein
MNERELRSPISLWNLLSRSRHGARRALLPGLGALTPPQARVRASRHALIYLQHVIAMCIASALKRSIGVVATSCHPCGSMILPGENMRMRVCATPGTRHLAPALFPEQIVSPFLHKSRQVTLTVLVHRSCDHDSCNRSSNFGECGAFKTPLSFVQG